MYRRTFLRTAGLAATASISGCLTSAGSRSAASAGSSGEWRQAAGDSGNTAQAPAVRADEVAWNVALPGQYATPPVVTDGTVVLGTASGTVLAVDLESGAERWQRETAGVQAPPAVVGQWTVVPADDGHLHRFALDDGSTPTPKLLGSSLLGPVTADQEHAYVLANPSKLVAVDVATWRVEWTTDLEICAIGKPAVQNDRVIVSGTRPDGSGDVLALDTAMGDAVWRARGMKGFHQTPIATESQVIVSGEHRNRLESWTADDDWTPSGTFWFDAGGDLERTEPIHGPIWEHCTVRFLAARAGKTTISGCNALVQYREDSNPWSRSVPQGVTTRPLATTEGVLVGDAHGQFWLVAENSRAKAFVVDGMPSTPAVLESGVIVPAGGRLIALV